MARMISWPDGVQPNGVEPLSGPRTIGSAQTQSMSGFLQTVAAPFGLLRLRFGFPPLRREPFRRYRGWITALHGGANATRVPLCDWDGMSIADLGVNKTAAEWKAGESWSDGNPWSNGTNWKNGPPDVGVAVASAVGDTDITLAGSYWGHALDIGDRIGFNPFSLGAYTITQVFGSGHYRIWPSLRTALGSSSVATLRPVLAMRLESEEAANAPRGASFAEGLNVTLVEVLDYDARAYFAD